MFLSGTISRHVGYFYFGKVKDCPCLGSEVKMKKYRKAEYVQRRVSFVNVKSSLHENVVFLFLSAWTMPRISRISCGIPFPVETPVIISG